MNQLASDDKMMSPTHDLVFKSLFTRDCEESKIILKDLISSVIGVKVDKVEIKGNELAKNDINEKQESLDINCTVNGGELINVEMYSEVKDGHLISNNYCGLINKSLYYATSLFSSQDMKGKFYDQIEKTIQITFTSNQVFKNSGYFVNEFVFADRMNCEPLTDSLTIIFIELPKLKDTIKNRPKFISETIWNALQSTVPD